MITREGRATKGPAPEQSAQTTTTIVAHRAPAALPVVSDMRMRIPVLPGRGVVTAVYEASPVNQKRRTNLQLAAVDEAIVRHIDQEHLRLTQIYEQSEREIFARMVGGGGHG